MSNLETFNRLVTHLKTEGFFFQNSHIYGGLANSFDLGPLGVELSLVIKQLWVQHFVRQQKNCVLFDSKIISHPTLWQASGHTELFCDTMVEEQKSKKRFRLSHLLEELFPDKAESLEQKPFEEILNFLNTHAQTYQQKPALWVNIRNFNLMFQTSIGTTKTNLLTTFLRPETAQGVFVNFKQIQRSQRLQLPFGVGQIGKAFRNEITPGHFVFRTREFEQLEFEYFCFAKETEKMLDYWTKVAWDFLLKCGIKEEWIRIRAHSLNELAHYSKATNDIEFEFPFGWGELLGVANRGSYDLAQHQKVSGENLEYLDPKTGQRSLPHIIETSIGLERLMLAILTQSFSPTNTLGEESIVLRLTPKLAPVQVMILPLLKQHKTLALHVFKTLKKTTNLRIGYDEKGSIGKRYRREDARGTPFCITIDENSSKDNTCTLRHRDSMSQETDRIKFTQLAQHLKQLINSENE